MPHTPIPEQVYWGFGSWGEPEHEPTLGNKTQVCIVGSGYTGLSAALHLARNGVQATVVDQEVGPGQGASGRNGGMVLSGYPLDCTTLIHKFGSERAKTLFSASRRAVSGVKKLVQEGNIACDLMSREHVTAAVRPGHRDWLRQEQESMAEISGTSPRLLDAGQMREELGTNAYWGGLVDPWSASLNPFRFAVGLHQMASDAGVEFSWSTRVHAIQNEHQRTRIRTSRGEIVADQVVLATNAFTPVLNDWLGRRVVPVESVMIATEEVPDDVIRTVLPRGNTVSDTKRVLHYFRKSPDGKRVLFGGRPPLIRGSLQDKALALHKDMLTVFPQLGSYKPARVWSGQVGFTRDHLPHSGDKNGLGYAMGYCGHGIALATYLGRQLAKAVLNGDNPRSLDFPGTPFPRFPLYRKRAWFVPLTLALFGLLDRFS
jgi:glycine/D-amino acid oxidase-like deaminating enzyme